MNWWFTNSAIILDTAGRLMFEEVAPGSTNEWKEFLKLLKQNRPNCPINGMLLVIPVDTLIKDTADNIEKKASKIAQQFDYIQRPWAFASPSSSSSPSATSSTASANSSTTSTTPSSSTRSWAGPIPIPSMSPSTPNRSTNTSKSSSKRLTDRRTHLLQDPVNTDDPNARRIEQVDALFALPESITKIGPRLRLYLEKIFVSGEWSPKPLFLRGIYFTSSMTEGSALDADLAEVLGVPVDALPEGGIWQRIAPTSSATSSSRKSSAKKASSPAPATPPNSNATASSSSSAPASPPSSSSLSSPCRALRPAQSVGPHRDFWTAAKDIEPSSARLVQRKAGKLVYFGAEGMDVAGRKSTVAQFYGSNFGLVSKDIDIPLIFRPVAVVSHNVNAERRAAYRTLFDQTIIDPLVDASRDKLANTSVADWNDNATGPLAQLLRIELANLKQTPVPAPAAGDSPMDLNVMLRFTLGPDDCRFPAQEGPPRKSDGDALQESLNWIYSPAGGGAWPPLGVNPDPRKKTGRCQRRPPQKRPRQLHHLLAQVQVGPQNAYLSALSSFKDALIQYQAAEEALLNLNAKPDKLNTYQSFLAEWNARLARVRDARTQSRRRLGHRR